MQTIIHSDNQYKNIHPILDEIERLYAYASTTSNNTLIRPIFDTGFSHLKNLFFMYGNIDLDITLEDKHYTKLSLPNYNSKNMIVCFSGGKDSIASAIHYKQLGYNVYLYHLRHINFALQDEYIHAQEIAEYLNMPIYIDDIKLSGKNDYMEHPMKNMIIANGALNYGIKNNIGYKIAFGNYVTSSLEWDVFERCAGDCPEMWTAYEDIIKRVIPGFHIYKHLKNLGTTLNIVSRDMKVLDMSVSCLCRSNLRQYRWNWIYNKFGIKLPKHRCGNCYKCCTEYIYLADHDKIKYSEDYYKYCLNQLRKVLISEGQWDPSLLDVWNSFLFYKRSKSKYNIIKGKQ